MLALKTSLSCRLWASFNWALLSCSGRVSPSAALECLLKTGEHVKMHIPGPHPSFLNQNLGGQGLEPVFKQTFQVTSHGS